MRHGKKFNHLGRKTAHRKAMLANMACSLIEHKRINTTVAKAKALRIFVEPLITKSKAANNVTAEKGTHNRRIVFKNLRDKYAVTELFSTVAEKIGDRPGGYTRIIKLGNRLGDNADMAMIELVDFNELYNAGGTKKKSTRRSRRGGGKKDESKVADKTEEVKNVENADGSKAAEAKDVEAKKAETNEAPKKEVVSESEAKAKSKSELQVESKSEAKTESKSEEKPKTENKPIAEDKSKSEDKPTSEDDPKSEDKPKTEAKTEDQSKAKNEPAVEEKSEKKADDKAKDAESKKDDSKD